MAEVENDKSIILYRWNYCYAGGASGSLDASNMFKPALARGEFK
jgi:ATP-dependent Clp protease ATP-binding subunit ClpA